MEDTENDFLADLRKGKKIKCHKCHIGYYVPYNTTADKAHAFECSNENCNSYINLDPIIDIE